jgi:electron transport complex protein RnfB
VADGGGTMDLLGRHGSGCRRAADRPAHAERNDDVHALGPLRQLFRHVVLSAIQGRFGQEALGRRIAMTQTPADNKDRRAFLVDGLRVAGAIAFAGTAGYVAGQSGTGEACVWQLDPDKCIACGNCATYCVLDISAVKCMNCYDMCGYCDICTGYFEPGYAALDSGAENQLCPTGAILRDFVEDKYGQRFYEYRIDEPLCIACGKCVKGCALMNGSLYMQVQHDRCVDCNECSIATACPTQAFHQIPVSQVEILKEKAVSALTAHARKLLQGAEDNPNKQREAQQLLDRVAAQRAWRAQQRNEADGHNASRKSTNP